MDAEPGGDLGPVVSGFSPPPLPHDLRLTGRAVRIVPLCPQSHSDDLFAAFRDHDSLWQYMPYGPFPDRAAFDDWLRGCAGQTDPVFVAFCRPDGQAVGVGAFLRIAPDTGTIEVGHLCFAPVMQATRAATEAMVLMMGWAFGAGYRRYEWKCNALNRPSRRAAERLGLSFEGVFRQAAIVKGRNRDTAWFAATDGDWPGLRAVFEDWLSDDNFDDQGRQRRRLSDMTRPLLYRADPGWGL